MSAIFSALQSPRKLPISSKTEVIMAAPLYTTASGLYYHAGKILILTVGLPARGKTHISRALERYLRWMGIKTLVVSLGDYRRRVLGSAQKLPLDYFTLGEKSRETEELRKKISSDCEQNIWNSFEQGTQIVIYDANNGTKARREGIANKFRDLGIHVIMLETICDNSEIVEANIRSVKISSPDYKGWDPEKAVRDYYNRIEDHKKYYQTVNTSWPFIKTINVGEKIEVNDIQGYLQSRIIFFLMNMHNKFRTIYFARSGISQIEHSYKADSDLSPVGWEYAERLKEFLLERRYKTLKERGVDPKSRKLVIWTSTRRRSNHTALPFVKPTSALPPYLSGSNASSGINSPRMRTATHLSTSVRAKDLNTDVEELLLDEDVDATVENTNVNGIGSFDVGTDGDDNDYDISPSMVKVIEKPQMSEINPGVWDGLTPEEVRRRYPDEWDLFVKDPYSFRARRAESYHDLSVRLEPTIIELERQEEDLLIIGHASVIRCLLSYLIGLPASELPSVEVVRGDLIEVIPASYGVISHAYHFWDGPGRRGESTNFYENYAEDTFGKKPVVQREI